MASISRVFETLELLARKGPMGMRAIAKQLGVPVGSMHRLLVELSEDNVVDRTRDGDWDLSFRLHAITSRHLERIGIADMVRPFATDIAEATGETVNVYVVSNGRTVCIDKLRGNLGMQLDMPIGHRGPLNLGGAGKCVLAYLAEEDREAILAQPLVAMTPYTLTRREDLEAEIARIRARGYAIDNQEVVAGVYCVTVPILDRQGRPAGAVSISGPSVKAAGDAAIEQMLEMLNRACEQVSRRLGYS
ncbi:MAG: IclR family transcriptional regulator, partial [Rubellimicrobium sp.]|nr:IclR family transcriptional regulator [Rubellimicrobium sp.]